MEGIKKFFSFLMFIVALVVGFTLVSLTVPFEFMTKYVGEEWFLELTEYVVEWGITALVVLGLSRMLAVNNKGAVVITIILYVVLSALIVMSLHYPEKLAELLDKIGL